MGCGPSKAGDRSSSLRPAISRAQLCELATARSLQDGLALIALIGRSFPLRIPSECLPLRRQQAGEDLDSEERLAWRAVIGLAGAKLVIKLNRRKHMASGSRLARACICGEYASDSLELHIPKPFCPACQLWPAIRERAPGPSRAGPERGCFLTYEASLRVGSGLELLSWGPIL